MSYNEETARQLMEAAFPMPADSTLTADEIDATRAVFRAMMAEADTLLARVPLPRITPLPDALDPWGALPTVVEKIHWHRPEGK